MFDLEQAITDWRQNMLAAGIQTPVPLEELEIHLREEIERQIKTGLHQPAAFYAAVQQLGPANTIQPEFEKMKETRGARKWKWTEIFLMVFTIVLPLFLSVDVIQRASVIDMTAAQELSSVAAMAVFTALAWAGRLSHRVFPVIASRRTRDAIVVLAALLLAVWWIAFMRLIVPRHDFTMSQFLVAFVWAFFSPAGAWVGWFWGMEAAAQKKSGAARA